MCGGPLALDSHMSGFCLRYKWLITPTVQSASGIKTPRTMVLSYKCRNAAKAKPAVAIGIGSRLQERDLNGFTQASSSYFYPIFYNLMRLQPLSWLERTEVLKANLYATCDLIDSQTPQQSFE